MRSANSFRQNGELLFCHRILRRETDTKDPLNSLRSLGYIGRITADASTQNWREKSKKGRFLRRRKQNYSETNLAKNVLR